MAQESKEKSTIRQSENNIHIEGIVTEFDIAEDSLPDGREIVKGEIKVQTDADSIHVVEVFAMRWKDKKKTEESRLAKGYLTLAETLESVSDVGKERATRVRINTGEIRRNEFYLPDGRLISNPTFSATFVNRVKENDEFNPKATFDMELFIANISNEIVDDEETGRLIVKGYTVNYNGEVIPMELIGEGSEAVDYIESEYETGGTVLVGGEIRNKVKTTVHKTESAFGKDFEKVEKETVRELVIQHGAPQYDEDDNRAYDPEKIKKAIAVRENMLEEKKKKAKEKANKKGSGANSTGTGAPKAGGFSTSKKKEDIPF